MKRTRVQSMVDHIRSLTDFIEALYKEHPGTYASLIAGSQSYNNAVTEAGPDEYIYDGRDCFDLNEIEKELNQSLWTGTEIILK